MNFRIARTDGPAFTFPRERYDVALRPIGTRARSEPVTKGWRIRVEKAVFDFELVSGGFNVAVTGTMPERRVRALMLEIAENIGAYTHEYARVEELNAPSGAGSG